MTNQRFALRPAQLLPQKLDNSLKSVRSNDLVYVLLHNWCISNTFKPHNHCRTRLQIDNECKHNVTHPCCWNPFSCMFRDLSLHPRLDRACHWSRTVLIGCEYLDEALIQDLGPLGPFCLWRTSSRTSAVTQQDA